MKKLILLTTTVIAALCITAAPRRIVTKVDEKAIKQRYEASVAIDSTRVYSGQEARRAVRFFGYDKPHNATQESLFVTNNLESDTIQGLSFNIIYKSMGGVELHTRTLPREVNILPGQTVRLQFPSWDATHTFYYFRTPPARKQGLTPYQVSIGPVTVTVGR
ncbi:MAG: hypothetical protein NC217_02755 [Muribaculaceae bacterium]|nr:hypothetical protein [Muribaculaceae bacterium]